MPKINQEEYEVLKDRIAEEIYSWDGAESGWGDDAVENVLEILDDFLEKQEHQVRKRGTEVPKINQEEYEVLKGLDKRAESIVRQARGWLWVAEQPIMKDKWSWFVADGFEEKLEDDNLFQFIQWEDEEPHNIAELIEEYESGLIKPTPWTPNTLDFESEDIEMKKDIEWLRAEVNIIIHDKLLDRIDNYDYMNLNNSLNELIDQLDELEVLSEEWIDEHRKSYTMEDSVEISDLQNLLVPKQELPVIPQNVADWITRFRDSLDLYQALKRLENSPTQVYKWYTMNNHKFVNAYLTGKYEVEEEPLYFALIKGHELMDDDGDMACNHWNLSIPDGRVFPGDRFSRHNEYLTKMSEEEWSKIGINESNAEFRKVGEVE